MQDVTHELEKLRLQIKALPRESAADIEELEERIIHLERLAGGELTSWDKVQLARHENRPYTLDYIERVFTGFREIHGDRRYGEDNAIVGGMAFLEEEPVMVIGQQKGRNMKQRIFRNYGMPNPEGYRKAMRLMRLAEKFNRSIICLIDTPGAYPGIGAEKRGQAQAIANNLMEMAQLQVPIVVTVIGEGGSGGALAIGVGDRVLMMEHSIYSVISPESCSAILWKDQDHVKEAAEALKLTAPNLLKFGVVDEIIPEPPGGNHQDWDAAAAQLKTFLSKNLSLLKELDVHDLLEQRYQRFRRIGEFLEE